MKHLAFLLFLVCPLYADTPTPEPSPTLDDYSKAIAKYKEATKKAFDLPSWKGIELTNKKTEETKKFEELSNFEQHLFLASSANRLTAEMTILKKHWDNEAAKFKDPNYKIVPLPKVEKPEQKAAELKDVEKYQAELLTLRKNFAVKHEEYLAKIFKDFKNDIQEKERDLYLKEVQDYHDKEKLIERKK